MFRSIRGPAGRRGRLALGLIHWAGGDVLRPTLEAVGGGSWHTEAWRSRTTADTTRNAKKEASFVFSEGYEISGGINPGIQTEFWPFPRR
jgi:hypothetical protein